MGFLGSTPMNGSERRVTLSSIPKKTFPASGRVSDRNNDAKEAWPARGISGPRRLDYFLEKGFVLQS